jgi:hypothetical protein
LSQERFSIPQAILRIGLSVLLVSGTFWVAWGVYQAFLSSRAEDPKYRIRALVQTGPEKEALKTAFLAELLQLSTDRMQNLYRFDLKTARDRLLAFPLIKEARLQRIPPQTLFLDYRIRKPIAFLVDRTNTAFDDEYTLIPVRPFFSPKRLPKIYWGFSADDALAWGDRLDGPKTTLIQQLLAEFGEDPAAWISLVDLSDAFLDSLGQRKVVVTVEGASENGVKWENTLILNPQEVDKGVRNYRALSRHEEIQGALDAKVIDLRIPGMGILN